MAFPAGWNNSRPWFVAAQQQQALPAPEGLLAPGGSGSSLGGATGNPIGGAGGVRPVMPPPPFPQQPWQGSRLGPLPPLTIYPGWGLVRPSEVRMMPLLRLRFASSLGCIIGQPSSGNVACVTPLLLAPCRPGVQASKGALCIKGPALRMSKPVTKEDDGLQCELTGMLVMQCSGPCAQGDGCSGHLQRGGLHQRGHRGPRIRGAAAVRQARPAVPPAPHLRHLNGATAEGPGA